MREEIITNLEDIFKEIAHTHNIDTSNFTYNTRKPFLEELKLKQEYQAKAVEKLINDLESLSFTKTDKELRFKAPDIYKIEMDRIKNDIEESKANLKSFFEDEYINRLISKVDEV